MDFITIKKQIASNIGLVDSTGNILTGKDITETNIADWVNNRYLGDLVSTLTQQYPEDYEEVATANFYKATSVANATSTNTTIDANDAIFNNSMVGDSIYNSTDNEIAKIVTVVSSTQVTIDTDVDETWDGDTIYVLGHEFALGGDATDNRFLREIAVKYSDSAQYYTVCQTKDQNKIFQYGDEVYSVSNPVAYVTTSQVETTVTGVVDASSTGTTLVATTGIFESGMVGATVSNDTAQRLLPLTHQLQQSRLIQQLGILGMEIQ
jgi:hypothetical protein